MLSALLALTHAAVALNPQSAQTVNKWIVGNSESRGLLVQSEQVTDSWSKELGSTKFAAHEFTQRLDHFDKSVNQTFGQRYWINKRHYKPGGPVIVLDGGETSGEDRLAFLDTGIVDILANATNGLGGLSSLLPMLSMVDPEVDVAHSCS